MIGILGGTFDPPHWGHLKLAQNFIEILKLDQLIWLPAGQPWQKDSHITSSKNRFALTQAAADDLKDLITPGFSKVKVSVSRIELDRQGPSYAIDAARELRSTYGAEMPLIWLMGADSYQNISSWKDWEQLPKFLHLAIANRSDQKTQPGIKEDVVKNALGERITTDPSDLSKSPCGKVFFDNNFHVDLSSTHIREGLRGSWDIQNLVNSIPPRVLELINSSGIYQ
jgi:nicotinate-nucleotide adenylyltransferase